MCVPLLAPPPPLPCLMPHSAPTVRVKVVKIMGISSSNRMAMMWSALLCLGPNCELHR